MPPAYADASLGLCSTSGDCGATNRGGAVSLGELLRTRNGGATIELPDKSVNIQDASTDFALSACGAVDISTSMTCGVCVGCTTDADCGAVTLADFSGELFAGAGLTSDEVDLAFRISAGSPAPKVYSFCSEMIDDVGFCMPCPNPFAPCGDGDFSGGSGVCDHGPCVAGGPLDVSCGRCEGDICDADPYCCEREWDSLCAATAGRTCGTSCAATACIHDECTLGAAIAATCSACTATICTHDPYCCEAAWDAICVYLAVTNDVECASCN